MSPQALALVLAAAMLHALWNIAAKRARHGTDDNPVAFQTLCALAVVVLWSPLGLWAMWRELSGFGWRQWAAVGLSAAVHLAYFSALLRGYQRADLTVVYPVARGTGPLVASVGAVLLFGEQPAWPAIGVILVGVLLVSGLITNPVLMRGGALPPKVAAGLRWGALTGVLIASYTVIDAYAVKLLLISPLLVDYLGNALRLPLLLPWVARLPAGSLREGWRKDWRAVVIVGVFAPLGYILVLWALQSAPLSSVAPARECSMLFAALIGGKLLGEGERFARLAGALCIALGVVLLAFR